MNPSHLTLTLGEIRVKASELGARGPLATRQTAFQLKLHFVSVGIDFMN